MFRSVLLVFYMWLFRFVSGNTTFTHEMEIRCKEHICRRGYLYESFYAIDANATKSDPNIKVEMHLAILAASNGHILLSKIPNPTKEDPVYEIVVGGGGNKFTELRRNLKRNAKVSTRSLGILSAIELRAFYLILYLDGTIKFGKEGENATLEYFDPDPLPIEFFSFASWQGVEARFLYDCPTISDVDSEVEPDSKEVKRFQPVSEQLKQTLLEAKSPYSSPNEIMEIALGVSVITTNYDVFQSILKTTLFFAMTWKDPTMAWDPSKFNWTTHLTLRPGQIWKPEFMPLNSADSGGVSPLFSEPLVVSSDGTVEYYMQAETTTWCVDYKVMKAFSGWPRDQYTCNLIIVPLLPHDNYKMELFGYPITKMVHLLKVYPRQAPSNAWVVSGKQTVATNSVWNKLIALDDNSTLNKSDKLIVTLSLTRNAGAYNVIFYTPLLVLSVFVLLSFWAEPLEMSRVWFHAGFSIVICLGLSFVDFLVPCHILSSILVLYTCVLGGNLLAMCLIILMMHPVMDPVFSSNFVQSILTTKTVRLVFCLEPLKSCNVYESVNENLYDDTEDLTSARNISSIEQMDPEPSNKKSSKEEFAIIVDKIMFFIYITVLAALLAAHY